mmetsp:Transcript_19779/g.54499  ORF Transcript_19779/g.54499 Transcript_19779/m.54499 type:complete len:619 (+) Transcript_19779:72-1928(+)
MGSGAGKNAVPESETGAKDHNKMIENLVKENDQLRRKLAEVDVKANPKQNHAPDPPDLQAPPLTARSESTAATNAGTSIEKATCDDRAYKVKNDPDAIKTPKEPTLLDSTLLFLPAQAVLELGLEPNMDDKGDSVKELWFGRVWELRALMALQYAARFKMMQDMQAKLSDARKAELAAFFQEPANKERLIRLSSRWRGAVLRARSSLRFLERLRFVNLRGTLVYAHGSGGCSWDNFRICRMISKMGMLVIAPDGFAYPSNTAMGQMRHKDLLPLKRADDDTDYWKGDLMYASGSEGTLTYSTKADSVLEDPEGYRETYEKCYQLRRSELHFILRRLPLWINVQGFFLGGTSEGAMSIARFDDQRYGEMVCGRFINSFSVEYCYFTPTPEDGDIGGQLDIPTLNIIGTKDQYFGAEDSISKIVAEDDDTGYGDENLTGNGFKTFLKQGLECALVCVLEDGVHSPCKTHDNFLRQLFNSFFARPGSIWELDTQWSVDPTMAELIQLKQLAPDDGRGLNVAQVFVPRMNFPQRMSLIEVDVARKVSRNYKGQIADLMKNENEEVAREQTEAKKLLDGFRGKQKCAGGSGFKKEVAKKKNYYTADRRTEVKHKKAKHLRLSF